MKKFMLLATMVGLTLTSCVNEEETVLTGGKSAIAFDAPVMKSSRVYVSGEISGVTYPTAETFTVFSKIYEGSYAGWTTSTDVKDYFNSVGDSTHHDGSYWATSTVYYWPDAGYNLAFSAYSPATFGAAASAATVTRTEEGIQIANFTTEPASDDQYDLMYSHTVYDRNKENNTGAAVNLLFEHALSSIVFSSQKSDAAVDYKITTIGVTGTFYTNGDFNQGVQGAVAGGVYSETENPQWTLKGTSSVNYNPNLPTAVDVPVASPAIFTGGTSAILTLPQDVPADAKVWVHYTKSSNGTSTDHVAEILLKDFKKADDTEITTWERGKRYVYRIAFGKNERIYFEPTVTDWVQESTLIYTIK